MSKLYLQKNVLEAARERVEFVFDRFENIHVSVSSGKDSTVLFHLCAQEALLRNRKVYAFFLDQEAEYAASIALMREMMRNEHVIPRWYQVPIYMTNATSYVEDSLHAWGEGEEWMRAKEPNTIHAIEGEYPKRFYPFFDWHERQQANNSAFMVGLRAEESLNRFRAVVKSASFEGIGWSTRSKNKTSHRFYPIYDWGMGDVWKFIKDERLPYNEIYDKMFRRNNNFYHTMRVSNLIHEKSFSCLADLQELEPDTYDKLIARIAGTHVAALYAKEQMVFAADKLPAKFDSWRDYREHLLATIPTAKAERFSKRFAGQAEDERTARLQVRQLLLNDYENSLSVTKPVKEDWRQKWAAIL